MADKSKKQGLPKFEWVIQADSNRDIEKLSKKLASSVGTSQLLAHVLISRGIETIDEIVSFLNPTKENLLPPEAIPGIEEATARIIAAIVSNEPVLIHGDYDADGIIGTVILHRTLKDLGCKSRIFLPERDVHGFGLAPQAVDIAYKNGIKLIITVDCGISSKESIAKAHGMGIEVIVSDHHAVPEDLPSDALLVHHSLFDPYPGGGISGSTVAYKLALSVIKASGEDFEAAKEYWLPLIAIATIADVCDLEKENRIIVAKGIALIKQSKIPAIKVLLDGIRSNGLSGSEITERDIAFGMSPLLNAPGRVGDPLPAAKFLMANDVEKAWKHFKELQDANIERKRMQEEIGRRITANGKGYDTGTNGLVLLIDENCPIGLAGLVAAGISERTGRAACVIVPGEDETGLLYRGSMRSSKGDDLLSIIAPLTGIAEKIGGHSGAVGLTVRAEKIDEFVDACHKIEYSGKSPRLQVDARISKAPCSVDETKELDRTRPWGNGNQQPLFVWDNLKIKGTRAVGKNAEHLQISLHERSGDIYKGIGFNMAADFPEGGVSGHDVSAAGHFQVNSWQGNETVEFQIKDLRFE
jgi:single-stranded-DNA-specific exonuclease